MPANNFEKKIQQEMEEFRLRPGDPVWENIEREINKKKKRRRALIFIPLFAGLLLAGYGGYKLFLSTKKNVLVKNDQQPADQTLSQPGNTSDDQAVKEPNSSKKINEKTGSPDQSVTVSKNHPVGIHRGSNKKIVQRVLSQSPQVDVVKEKNNNPAVDQDKPVVGSNEKTIENKVVSGKTPQVNIPDNDTASKKPAALIPDLANPAEEKLSMTTTPQKGKRKSTSAFSISLAPGLSDIRNTSASNNSNLGVIVGYPGAANLRRATFSRIAFKAAINWEKQLSKKLRFTAGLGYAFYSYEKRVGGQIAAPLQVIIRDVGNQSVNFYYAGPLEQKFVNKFHFIEIPATIQWQLNRSRKVPISLDAGLSIARLVSSNALLYDTAAGGVYFHSNELLSKTHFNFIGGLNIGWNNLTIGPKVSLDLTRNFPQGMDHNQYLVGAYLEIRYRFPSKSGK